MTQLRRLAPARLAPLRIAAAVLATLLLAALLLAPAAAAEPAQCEVRAPATGPVSIIILQSARSVHELAGSLARGARVVAKDAGTVIFDDGRVITADVEAAGAHLNRLGWGARPIRVVASFSAAPPRPRRDRG